MESYILVESLGSKIPNNEITRATLSAKRLQTLKTGKEFDFVYKNSRKFRNDALDICVLDERFMERFYARFTRPIGNLMGLSVSKKVGSAVVRNLIKRRLRHACGEIFAESRGKGRTESGVESSAESSRESHAESHAKSSTESRAPKNRVFIVIAKAQILQMPFAALKSHISKILQ